MPIADYDELQDLAANYLARDDLTAEIKDFIRLAEHRIQQELELVPYRASVTGSTLDAALSYLALPTGFTELISLTILSDPISTIQIATPAAVETLRDSETSGIPKFGYITGSATGDQRIEFGPAQNAAHSYRLEYWNDITPLSASAKTNALLTQYPNLLLYGALLEAEEFLKVPAPARQFKEMYGRAAQNAKRKEFRRRTGGKLRMQPDQVA